MWKALHAVPAFISIPRPKYICPVNLQHKLPPGLRVHSAFKDFEGSAFHPLCSPNTKPPHPLHQEFLQDLSQTRLEKSPIIPARHPPYRKLHAARPAEGQLPPAQPQE